MSVLSGYVTKEELEKLKKRIDITILEERTEDIEEEWKGHTYVVLDCDWGIMEFLENFPGGKRRMKTKRERIAVGIDVGNERSRDIAMDKKLRLKRILENAYQGFKVWVYPVKESFDIVIHSDHYREDCMKDMMKDLLRLMVGGL